MKTIRFFAALLLVIALFIIDVLPALAAPIITIYNPTTIPAQSKTITATTSAGTLTMRNTTGLICDDTLTFDAYSSQTFTSESDNGTRVCYKADDSGDVAYSLSDPISGIDTTAPIITINNPTTTPAKSKTITANASDGTLSMSNTNGAICDESLMSFVAYSDQTFTSESDNGMKVCYRAVDTAGNIAFNLSNAIAGIDTTAPTAAITYSGSGQYKSGAVATITATFNEDMAVSPIPRIAISGVINLSPTDMTRTSSTVYTYQFTVGAGNGTATVALSDGTDLAGNVVISTPSSGATFTVDNLAPSFTSVAPASSAYINNITTASDVSYTLSEDIASGSIVMTQTGGSTDTNSPHTCTLTDSARTSGVHANLDLSAGVGCTTTQTLVNGTIYTFVFSGIDPAGNSASPVSRTGVTYDSIAPTAAITYSPAGPYKSLAAVTITATFTEAMATSPVPQISISGANNLAATNMTRASSTRYTYAYTVGPGDGTATIALSTGTDLAGNIVASAPTSGATFTVDNTPPVFSAVSPASGAYINSITTASDVSYTLNEAITSGSIVMTRTGGSTDNTVHTCTLSASARTIGVHNNLSLSSGAGCTSNQTLVNRAIYTFVFSGTDAAGNAATPLSNTGVTYDTTVPTAAITYSAPGPYKAGTLLTITATFSEDMADTPVPQISISGANSLAATNMTKSSSKIYTYPYSISTGDGTATVALSTGTDLAGNLITALPTAGSSFTVDNTAPIVTVTTFPTVNDANKAAVTLSGACESASGTVSLAVTDIGPANTVTASPTCSGGAWTASSLNLTALNDGTLTATATQTDIAGNVGTGSLTSIKDITAPIVTVTSFPTVNNANKAAVTLSGACESASGTVSLVVADVGPANTVVTSPACSGGVWTASSLNLTALNDGTLTATATQTNGSGNVGTGSLTSSKDVVAPTVGTFTVTTPSNSLNIPITAFTALDTVGVTGYLITTTATPPAPAAVGWSGTPPATFKVASDGSYTLYPWAKDAAGNVSNLFNTPRTVSVDTIAPTVTNVTSTTANGSYTIGTLIPIRVTFSEVVNAIGIPQLIIETGTTDRTATYSSGTGTNILTFNYSVQTGDNSADLDYVSTTSLTLNGATIKDAAFNNATLTLPAPGTTGSLGANKAIVIDTTAPTIRIGAPSVPATKTGPVTFAVTFADTNFNTSTLGVSNITLNRTGDATGSVGVTGSGLTYTVTISVISGNGTLGISIAAGTASDTAGNLAPAAGPSTTVIVDTTVPNVSWVAPSPCGNPPGCQYYNVYNQGLRLAVNPTDIAGISKVVFRRWEYNSKIWIEIKTIYNSPYSFIFDTSQLLPSWNEIDVMAYDTANNFTESYIYLQHVPYWMIYSPLITR